MHDLFIDFIFLHHRWNKISVILSRLCMELEESTSVEVNNPGTFPTVCVELGISSLAVNTIIEVHIPTT